MFGISHGKLIAKPFNGILGEEPNQNPFKTSIWEEYERVNISSKNKSSALLCLYQISIYRS